MSARRCDVGSKSEEPCREVAVATYEAGHHTAHPGLELHVCEDHAIDAFRGARAVTSYDGEELGYDADGDYSWGGSPVRQVAS